MQPEFGSPNRTAWCLHKQYVCAVTAYLGMRGPYTIRNGMHAAISQKAGLVSARRRCLSQSDACAVYGQCVGFTAGCGRAILFGTLVRST